MISIPRWLRNPDRSVAAVVAVSSTIGCIAVLAWDVLALFVVGVFPEHVKIALTRDVPLITLLLLSLYVLASMQHDRAQPHLTRAADLGIKNIYKSRVDEGQMASYLELLQGAKKELFIVGITLKDVGADQFDHLVERASSGCQVDLLMLSPKFRANKDPILDPVARRDLTPNFCLAIEKIRGLAKAIREKEGRLTVKFYETAPTVSLTVRDGNSQRGRMHIEVIPHQTGAIFRPILDVAKEGKDEIFSEFYGRYRALWKDSREYISVDPKWSDIRVNEKLDHDVSEWLSINPDWRDAG